MDQSTAPTENQVTQFQFSTGSYQAALAAVIALSMVTAGDSERDLRIVCGAMEGTTVQARWVDRDAAVARELSRIYTDLYSEPFILDERVERVLGEKLWDLFD